MSRILSVNHRSIWTRSRSQKICVPERPQFPQPAKKKFKFDDDENAECLGFSADEIYLPNFMLLDIGKPRKQESEVKEAANPVGDKPKKGGSKAKKSRVGKKPQVIDPEESPVKEIAIAPPRKAQRKRKADTQKPAAKRQTNADHQPKQNPTLANKKQQPAGIDPLLASVTPLRRKFPVAQKTTRIYISAVDVREKPVTSAPVPVSITKLKPQTLMSPLLSNLGDGQLSQYQRNLLRINSTVSVSRIEDSIFTDEDLPKKPPKTSSAAVPKVDMRSLVETHEKPNHFNGQQPQAGRVPNKAPPKVKPPVPALLPIGISNHPANPDVSKGQKRPKISVVFAPTKDPITQVRKIVKMEAVKEEKVDATPIVQTKLVREGEIDTLKMKQAAMKKEALASPARRRAPVEAKKEEKVARTPIVETNFVREGLIDKLKMNLEAKKKEALAPRAFVEAKKLEKVEIKPIVETNFVREGLIDKLKMNLEAKKKEALATSPPLLPRALVGYKTTNPQPPYVQQTVLKSPVNPDFRQTESLAQKSALSTRPDPPLKKIAFVKEQSPSMSTVVHRKAALSPESLIVPEEIKEEAPEQNEFFEEEIEIIEISDDEPDPPQKPRTPQIYQLCDKPTVPFQQWQHNQGVLAQLKQAIAAPDHKDTLEEVMRMSGIVNKQPSPPRYQPPPPPMTFIFTQNDDQHAPSTVLLTSALVAEILEQSRQVQKSVEAANALQQMARIQNLATPKAPNRGIVVVQKQVTPPAPSVVEHDYGALANFQQQVKSPKGVVQQPTYSLPPSVVARSAPQHQASLQHQAISTEPENEQYVTVRYEMLSPTTSVTVRNKERATPQRQVTPKIERQVAPPTPSVVRHNKYQFISPTRPFIAPSGVKAPLQQMSQPTFQHQVGSAQPSPTPQRHLASSMSYVVTNGDESRIERTLQRQTFSPTSTFIAPAEVKAAYQQQMAQPTAAAANNGDYATFLVSPPTPQRQMFSPTRSVIAPNELKAKYHQQMAQPTPSIARQNNKTQAPFQYQDVSITPCRNKSSATQQQRFTPKPTISIAVKNIETAATFQQPLLFSPTRPFIAPSEVKVSYQQQQPSVAANSGGYATLKHDMVSPPTPQRQFTPSMPSTVTDNNYAPSQVKVTYHQSAPTIASHNKKSQVTFQHRVGASSPSVVVASNEECVTCCRPRVHPVTEQVALSQRQVLSPPTPQRQLAPPKPSSVISPNELKLKYHQQVAQPARSIVKHDNKPSATFQHQSVPATPSAAVRNNGSLTPQHQMTPSFAKQSIKTTATFQHQGVFSTPSASGRNNGSSTPQHQMAPPDGQPTFRQQTPSVAAIKSEFQHQLVPSARSVRVHYNSSTPQHQVAPLTQSSMSPATFEHREFSSTPSVGVRNNGSSTPQSQVAPLTQTSKSSAPFQHRELPATTPVGQPTFKQQMPSVAARKSEPSLHPQAAALTPKNKQQFAGTNPPLGPQKVAPGYYSIKKIGNSAMITKKSSEEFSVTPRSDAKAPAQLPQGADESIIVRPDQLFEKNGIVYAIIKKNDNVNIQSRELIVTPPSTPSPSSGFKSLANNVRNDQNVKRHLNKTVHADYADDLKATMELMKKRQAAGKAKKLVPANPKPKPQPKPKAAPKKHYYVETIDLTTTAAKPTVSVDLTMPPAMGTRRATKRRNLMILESQLSALGVNLEMSDERESTPASTPVKKARKSYHTPDFVKCRPSFQYDHSLTGVQLLQTPEMPVYKDALWGEHTFIQDAEMAELLNQSPAVMVQYEPANLTPLDLSLNGLFRIPMGELLDTSKF